MESENKMNKRLGRILALTLVILTLATTAVFAGSFQLTQMFPEDGSKTAVPQNVAIKLIFNENISSESAQKANEGIFRITAADGSVIEYEALYNADKYPNEVWLQTKQDLVIKETYTVTIPSTMVSSDGETLGKVESKTFTIRDTARDNTVYMVLMVGMMVLMMFLTTRDAARKIQKEQEAQKGSKAVAKVNPYKESKKSGKSIGEINAATDAKKARAEAAAAKRAAKEAELMEKIRKEVIAARKKAGIKRAGVYSVSGRRPISAAGVKAPASVLQKHKATVKASGKAPQNQAQQQPQHTKSKGSKQQQKKNKK